MSSNLWILFISDPPSSTIIHARRRDTSGTLSSDARDVPDSPLEQTGFETIGPTPEDFGAALARKLRPASEMRRYHADGHLCYPPWSWSIASDRTYRVHVGAL